MVTSVVQVFELKMFLVEALGGANLLNYTSLV